MQVAVSINGPQIGRQLNEGDVFYTYLNSRQAKMLLGRFNHKLNEEENLCWTILSHYEGVLIHLLGICKNHSAN